MAEDGARDRSGTGDGTVPEPGPGNAVNGSERGGATSHAREPAHDPGAAHGQRHGHERGRGGTGGTGGTWDHLEWVRATDDPDPDAECIEIAETADGLVHIRQTDEPDHVVTTTRAKWHAFVLGVRNNEFDHFVQDQDHGG